MPGIAFWMQWRCSSCSSQTVKNDKVKIFRKSGYAGIHIFKQTYTSQTSSILDIDSDFWLWGFCHHHRWKGADKVKWILCGKAELFSSGPLKFWRKQASVFQNMQCSSSEDVVCTVRQLHNHVSFFSASVKFFWLKVGRFYTQILCSRCCAFTAGFDVAVQLQHFRLYSCYEVRPCSNFC